MLDVHAPEHGINGLRDFFIHLLTITAGLLIALGLEASVEAMHHRHQRQEAEALIREEIRNNLNYLHQEAPFLIAESKGMNNVLATLENLSQGEAGTLQKGDVSFREAPMQDAAWRTASTTGVLIYCDYAEVERFSEAYKQQALLQSIEEQALEDYLELEPVLSRHGKDVDAETAKEALPFARRIVAHLSGLLAVGQGTIGSYEEALK